MVRSEEHARYGLASHGGFWIARRDEEFASHACEKYSKAVSRGIKTAAPRFYLCHFASSVTLPSDGET
jgi:hypothetical protein